MSVHDELLEKLMLLDDKDWDDLVEKRRIWKQVDRKEDINACWNWIGCSDSRYGYGIVNYHKKLTRAHRAIYLITHPEGIPDSLVVRHKCDNKSCCNPNHLELGTYLDNLMDWQTRSINQKGENNFYAKLTEEKVKEIRVRYSNGELQKTLAEEFGVDTGSISQIVTGWSWKETYVGERKKRKHKKLTSEQMESIISEYNPVDMQQNKLAKKYGVSRATIKRILIGDYIT